MKFFKAIYIFKQEKKLKRDLVVLYYQLGQIKAYPHKLGIIDDNVLPLHSEDKLYKLKINELHNKISEIKILMIDKNDLVKSKTYKVYIHLYSYRLYYFFIFISIIVGLGLKYLTK